MPISTMLKPLLAALALAGSLACDGSSVAAQARFKSRRAAALDAFCPQDGPVEAGQRIVP